MTFVEALIIAVATALGERLVSLIGWLISRWRKRLKKMRKKEHHNYSEDS